MSQARIVPDLLRRAAAFNAERTAVVVDGVGEMTFGGWEASSNRVARALVARGLQPGDRVGILFDNRDAIPYLVGYQAVHKAGGVGVPLSPLATAPERQSVLAKVEASALLHARDGDLGVAAELRGPAIRLDGDALRGIADPSGGADGSTFQVPREADDLADILFTSGTTGEPKGVACTHADTIFKGSSMLSSAFRHAVLLHALPMFTFAATHAMSLIALRGSMTQVIQPRFDAARFLDLITDRSVRIAYAVPAMLLRCLAEPRIERGGFDSLQLLLYGTAPMPPHAIEALGTHLPKAMLINLYGLTEGGAAVCSLSPDQARQRPTSVGRPLPPTEVRIVDEDGAEVAPGERGEIRMRTGVRPRRYWRDEAATADTWTDDGWVRTGDIGVIDADGYLYLVDRKKDLIIVGGHNVSAPEVEAVLLGHPAVREAALIGTAHPVLGEVPKAFVVADGDGLAEELQAFVAARLPAYKVPRQFVFLGELPRNAIGKVLKRRLREHEPGHEVREVDVGGYSVRVRELGAGPAIVFGHSLTFGSLMFDAAATRLAERFRVVLIEMPGHGGSGTRGESFTLEDVADDMATLMTALDLPRAAWVGHSMGGMVGLRLALRHPGRVSALALLNTSADAELPTVQKLYDHVNEESRGKPSTPPTVRFVLSLMFSEPFRSRHPDRVAPYEKLLYEPADAEGVYRAARAVIWRGSVAEELSSLSVPTLVVTSDADTAVPAKHGQTIADRIPGARRVHLEGCGHMSPVERPDAIAEALASFLDRAALEEDAA